VQVRRHGRTSGRVSHLGHFRRKRPTTRPCPSPQLGRVATRRYIAAVKAVSVRELKNRLSALLREVATGETVVVTNRGRVVAELRRPSVEVLQSPAEQALGRLVAEGVLTIGLPHDPASYQRTGVRLAGQSPSVLDAERADR
jgi:antitoxin (DNA-binding transcriptional repressor) of toxin-antitoxin stability system